MHKWQYISYQAPFLSNPSRNSSIACIRLNFSLFSFFFWPNFFTRCYYGSSAMLNSSTVDDKNWCREDSRQMPAAGCLILRTIPHLNGQLSERWEDKDKHKDKHNDKDDKSWCWVDPWLALMPMPAGCLILRTILHLNGQLSKTKTKTKTNLMTKNDWVDSRPKPMPAGCFILRKILPQNGQLSETMTKTKPFRRHPKLQPQRQRQTQAQWQGLGQEPKLGNQNGLLSEWWGDVNWPDKRQDEGQSHQSLNIQGAAQNLCKGK